MQGLRLGTCGQVLIGSGAPCFLSLTEPWPLHVSFSSVSGRRVISMLTFTADIGN